MPHTVTKHYHKQPIDKSQKNTEEHGPKPHRDLKCMYFDRYKCTMDQVL